MLIGGRYRLGAAKHAAKSCGLAAGLGSILSNNNNKKFTYRIVKENVAFSQMVMLQTIDYHISVYIYQAMPSADWLPPPPERKSASN